MKRVLTHLLGLSPIVYAGISCAGNSALMADNAEQLVKTANQVAETQVPKDVEGRYRLSGWVVGEGPTLKFSRDGRQWLSVLGALTAEGDDGAVFPWSAAASGAALRHQVAFSPSALAGDLADDNRYVGTISIGSVPAPVFGRDAGSDVRPILLWPLDPGKASGSDGSPDPAVSGATVRMGGMPIGGGQVLKSW
jgi:hypothetical protein